jgi:hypothetical protein
MKRGTPNHNGHSAKKLSELQAFCISCDDAAGHFVTSLLIV